jgi:hypothetical protein
MTRATTTPWILSAELVSLMVSAAHAVARMRCTQRYYQHNASQSPPIAIYPGARTRWPRRLAKRLVWTPSPIGLYGRQSAHSILETRRRRSDPSVLMLQSELTPLSMSSVREKRIRSPSGENSMTRSRPDPLMFTSDVTVPEATSLTRSSVSSWMNATRSLLGDHAASQNSIGAPTSRASGPSASATTSDPPLM